MTKQDYVTLACSHLGVATEQVLDSAIRNSDIVLIIDHGIQGAPKVTVPLALLDDHTPDSVPKIDATTGAVTHAKAFGVDIADVARFVNYERVTVHSVKKYLQRGD